jgi:hypothetical protein
MKRLHVYELLSGALLPAQFEAMYAPELSEHLRLLRKGGASAPVILSGEECIIVDETGFYRLLQSFSAASLSQEMLSYVLDALTLDMQSRFMDPAIREMAMDLADDDFSQGDVEIILRRGAQEAN